MFVGYLSCMTNNIWIKGGEKIAEVKLELVGYFPDVREREKKNIIWNVNDICNVNTKEFSPLSQQCVMLLSPYV